MQLNFQKQPRADVLWNKYMFLKFSQNSQYTSCAGVFFNRSPGLQLYLKEAAAQVFYSEFWKTSKNTSGQLLLNFQMSAFYTIVFLLGSIAAQKWNIKFQCSTISTYFSRLKPNMQKHAPSQQLDNKKYMEYVKS